MSVLEMGRVARQPIGATWSQVSPKLWVATDGGEFVGTVELLDDGFVGYAGRAREVGSFADLESAKQQVLRSVPSRGAHRQVGGAADEPMIIWALVCLAAFAFAVVVLTAAQGFLS